MTDNTQPDNPIPKPVRVIFKYEFKLGNIVNEIETYEGAQILHVHGNVIWMLVDISKAKTTRKIYSVRTGDEMIDPRYPENLKHIGSTYKPSVGDGSGCVYHMFEEDVGDTVRLSPELKRWLRRKVEKDLQAELTAQSTASVLAVFGGGTSVASSNTDYLQRLLDQLLE